MGLEDLKGFNVSNISVVTAPNFDETLNVGYWEHNNDININNNKTTTITTTTTVASGVS